MDTIYAKLKRDYRSLPITVTTHSASEHIARLKEELLSSPYTLASLKHLLGAAKTFTSFVAPYVRLNVIGQLTPRDTKTCKKVCKRVACVQRVYPTKPNKLTIWLCLSTEQRNMPTSGMIEAQHINGGYTYVHGHEIFVYRREEFPKVILHEVIHHTSLQRLEWSPASLKELYDFFHISQERCGNAMEYCHTSLAPNEAIVEAWAEVLHVMFLSIEFGLDYRSLYDAEVRHALQQTCKVLGFQSAHQPLWKEGTHAYSYIVLRTLLLMKFEEWCGRSYKTEEITALFIKIAKSTEFKERLLSCLPIPAQNIPSLRMSYFGDF